MLVREKKPIKDEGVERGGSHIKHRVNTIAVKTDEVKTTREAGNRHGAQALG